MKRAAALVLVSVLALTSCGSTQPIVADIGPAQIHLPIVHSGEVATAKRIVALANGSAEIVASLGYQANLVGRDIASTMPELAKIPVDTDAHQISVERVLSQHPDLILIDSSASPATAITQLKQSGIKVVLIPSPFTIAGVLEKESAVAQAIGTPKAAALLAKSLTGISYPASKTKVAFLYLRGTASIYLIGGKGSGADSLFQAIGVQDVGAHSLKTPFTIAGVLEKESAVASAIGTPKAAALLAKSLTGISYPTSKTRVAFLYLRGTASIYLIGGKGSGADSLFQAIGVQDVGAQSLKTPFTALSAEALIQMQPDVIVLMTKGLASVGGVDGLVQLPGIAQTPAGKNKRIVTVDDSLLLSFGPRTAPLLPLLRAAIDKAMAK